MIKLGANILSLNVQRSLDRSTKQLSSTSQRLASGMRINQASDDAAGLAISMSLNADSRVYAQGMRNLNDGISAISIAEGALGQLTTIVERVQELATQAMNGSFSDTQRSSMQQEISALQAEWNRIVESTTFNGTRVLSGEGSAFVLQGGAGTNGVLAVQVGEQQKTNGLAGFAGGLSIESTGTGGAEANGPTTVNDLSSTGRFLVMQSTASNLVANDANGSQDVFLKDFQTGQMTLVSVSSSGIQGNGSSQNGQVSGDGRYVVFQSAATNLVSGDTNGSVDVFRRDMLTGETVRVSTDSQGNQVTGDSSALGISADGRYALFVSASSTLVSGDTNGGRDIFLKDMISGTTTLVSSSSAGVVGNGESVVATMSADGRYIAFQSQASNLVQGDTNGDVDAFVKDTLTGETRRVSVTADGQQVAAGATIGAPRISADGKYVAFSSPSSAFGALSGFGIFVKNLQTGELVNAATDSSGTASATGWSTYDISADGRFVAITHNLNMGMPTHPSWQSKVKDLKTGEYFLASQSDQGVAGFTGPMTTAISDDGRTVVFSSANATLVSGDTNGVADVFKRDLTKIGVSQMAGLVVSNRASAGLTLDLTKNYADQVLQYRSKIGATSSRIQSYLSNLASTNINYTQAASRITDADVAEESATLVRSTILRQTASALLAQANRAPELALKLLKS